MRLFQFGEKMNHEYISSSYYFYYSQCVKDNSAVTIWLIPWIGTLDF